MEHRSRRLLLQVFRHAGTWVTGPGGGAPAGVAHRSACSALGLAATTPGQPQTSSQPIPRAWGSSHTSWQQHAGHGSSQALLCGLLSAGGMLAAAPLALADAPQGVPGSPALDPTMPVSETAAHPLDYDPVTNEHTAKMTMARAAALEYYQAGKWRQAEAKFVEALQEARLGFDPKDPHIASCQNNLAEFYRNTGQHSKAEQLYQEALELLESIYGEKHWLYASAMHNLALSHEEAGNLDKAADTMERVMSLRLVMFGARHFLYADSMFCLGHMLLKQATRDRKAAGGDGQAQAASGVGDRKGWAWPWAGSGAAAGKESADVKEAKGLGLMKDAVQILEDAESTQLNVLVGWLGELGEQCKQRGRMSDAVQCARKALHFFAQDKGDLHAQASQLSDALIEVLMEGGQIKEARDQAAACATARQEMFGRELVVAQAWLRVALLEHQLAGQGQDVSGVLTRARQAAALSEDMLRAPAKGGGVGSWLGGRQQGPDRGLKRARAAHVYGTAIKLVAELDSNSNQVVGELEKARSYLEANITAATQQLHQLSTAQGRQGSGSGAAAAAKALSDAWDETAGLYVELQLLLVECLDALSRHLGLVGALDKQRQVQISLDQVSRDLLDMQGGAASGSS